MSTIPSGSTIIWAAPDAVTNFNWINAISGWLTLLGLSINGAVSGQINLGSGSIAIPGTITSNTTYSMGYEVRQMISSGLPTLQVRVDYQLFATGTTAASLWPVIMFTVGTVANASTGVISGAATTAAVTSANTSTVITGNASTSSRPIFMSSDGGNFLSMCVDPARVISTPATTLCALVIERSLTASNGAYNANGYQAMGFASSAAASASNGSGCWNVNLSTGSSTYASGVGVSFPAIMFTSSGSGLSPTISPVTVMLPAPQGPMLAAVGYFFSDIANGVQFDANVYGTSHHYLATGVTYYSFSQSATSAGVTTGFGAQRMAMRYE